LVVLKISFSKSLPAEDKRLIEHKLWRNSGSLPGFGRVMIFVSHPSDQEITKPNTFNDHRQEGR
jgi:hypothetical protein